MSDLLDYSNHHRIVELGKLPDILDLEPGLIKKLPPMAFSSLLRVEHDFHGNAQRCRVLYTRSACRWLLIWQHLVVKYDDALGAHGRYLGLQDTDASRIVVVMHDLAEIVGTSTWQVASKLTKLYRGQLDGLGDGPE